MKRKEPTLEDYFAEISKSESGRHVLKAILKLTKFKQLAQSLEHADLIAHESKREVWVYIRGFIPPKMLEEIEKD